jgi:hypothetical protein
MSLRSLAAIFGVLLSGISIAALVFAIALVVLPGQDTGPVDPDLVALPLAALLTLVGIPLGVIGAFLLIRGFKKRR